jgi:hypothetical protein
MTITFIQFSVENLKTFGFYMYNFPILYFPLKQDYWEHYAENRHKTKSSWKQGHPVEDYYHLLVTFSKMLIINSQPAHWTPTV